ncbi:receptor-interacting serine/threonine-protein kinase 3-like isoform X2 [Cynoglossus semilaevis]|uniref:receptor-interacting serine/threonine-protein kinase 3-like isoform X2 n=1 Tax=Cynoglossus semilaevis TaxID=244447 RepID=UPI000D62F630|nr:receptor-interacting serine/threonine-protein kinase 3-like isoform X2 [Cynoglossus semilaevis]
MAPACHATKPVDSDSLMKWTCVGSGGFGCVYKARHKQWGFDVAVKLLHDDVGNVMPKDAALLQEISHMEKVSCEFVLRVYGTFEGVLPFRGISIERGIVMEFMSRGSVQTLLQDLHGHPPWPLTFRLANQVVLGMNFLHSRKIIHQDLKPSNVLLNDDLHAKLADFGLSRISTSASSCKTTVKVGGSRKYMPPEAFEVSYEPVRAFDIYSYAILLWSLLTGKEPYPLADNSLVALQIPLGQRPSYKDINQEEVEGLKELVDLMKTCWDGNPLKRPNSRECLNVTEDVYSKHRKDIHAAIKHVLTQLESNMSTHNTSGDESNKTQGRMSLNETVNASRIAQAEADVKPEDRISRSAESMNAIAKAKFVDDNRAALIQNTTEVMAIVEELGEMVHRETRADIEAKKTSQEQMRELFLKTFHPGGVAVKAAFYSVLEKHHPELLEKHVQ